MGSKIRTAVGLLTLVAAGLLGYAVTHTHVSDVAQPTRQREPVRDATRGAGTKGEQRRIREGGHWAK